MTTLVTEIPFDLALSHQNRPQLSEQRCVQWGLSEGAGAVIEGPRSATEGGGRL